MNMRWDLSALYESFDSDAFQSDLQKADQLIANALDDAKVLPTKAGSDADKLTELLKMQADLTEIMTKLYGYTHLVMATDAKDNVAMKYYGILGQKMVSIEMLEASSVQWIGSINDLDGVIASSDYLKEHSFIIKEAAKKASHLLSPDVEEAVARLQVDGSRAWSQLRSQIEATLMVEIEVDGASKAYPLPMARNFAYEADPKLRKAAFEGELKAYKKVELPVASCMNAIKGEIITISKLRGYASPLDMVLEESRADRETLDAMLEAIREYLPTFRKYLRAKGKLLGHENGLPFYDLFAPIGESDITFTYEEAHAYLVENFKSFSDELSQFVDHAFTANWIDAEVREGKRGGAFCMNLHPIKQSRVMSNFNGSFSQTDTLAHELGHAFHGYCLKDVSPLNASYPMPLAETASIFNETLIFNAALSQANDEDRFALMESELMNNTQVIVDIYSRFLFESEVIKNRESHGMTVDQLKEAMEAAQKEAYGDGLDENTLHPYMWVCKPHYYMPSQHFYNWPYAFGLLFALGVYARYQEVGESFVSEYSELLRATGCNSIVDVAKQANIDVHDVNFWRKSLATVTRNVDDFCELVEKRLSK